MYLILFSNCPSPTHRRVTIQTHPHALHAHTHIHRTPTSNFLSIHLLLLVHLLLEHRIHLITFPLSLAFIYNFPHLVLRSQQSNTGDFVFKRYKHTHPALTFTEHPHPISCPFIFCSLFIFCLNIFSISSLFPCLWLSYTTFLTLSYCLNDPTLVILFSNCPSPTHRRVTNTHSSSLFSHLAIISLSSLASNLQKQPSIFSFALSL